MKKRLMIVDDSRVMELQIRKLLEDSDYEVAAYCENGEEAIASYREVLPDIVLTDIIMPGIDGLEAAQVIVEEHPQARVVMMTSLTDDGSLNEADTVGARGFLVKPLTREALLEALDEALQDT
ncbi:response regulator [Oscillospiraceae bacterium 42-9]|uniref:response regulator n=1 Tax=Acutalibacter sp. TaxID=1918636 RepID=UPI00216F731F|nr:response regulator [Acutalibacter sp.]